jgi:hypothetical protein
LRDRGNCLSVTVQRPADPICHGIANRVVAGDTDADAGTACRVPSGRLHD